MSKGYIEASVIKCLIVGAAGVGKTHLKHLLLKSDPPEHSTSTGLATNPVRAISSSLVGVDPQDSDDWFVIENHKALIDVMGNTIKEGVALAPSLHEVVKHFPKIDTNCNGPSDGHRGIASACPSSVDLKQDTLNTIKRDTVLAKAMKEELTQCISDSSADNKKLLSVKLIQLIDSGGQLQYHDILPFFIQNVAVTLFVLNLSEDLAHQPVAVYHHPGGEVSDRHQSPFSHGQILQQYLGIVPLQRIRPSIIVVGTHRDVENACNESIDDKNSKLQRLLNPEHFNVIYNGEELTDLIFPVNGKEPNTEDKSTAQALRKLIVSKTSQKPMKLPVSWFGLEVLLQRLAQDVGILSLEECKRHAESIFIDEDTFSAALHHLVHHNVFLYYPTVLPQTVFCNPQVIFNKVTELVQYHNKLRNNPQKGVATEGELVAFRDQGILSLAVLNKHSTHYREGLFTPRDLLKVLSHLGVVADINKDQHFMPSLLPWAEKSQTEKQNSLLALQFERGSIPSGLFCCLVAFLLSPQRPDHWVVCKNSGRPRCMHRNRIALQQKDTAIVMTLTDRISHIEVQGNSTWSYKDIRDCLHLGIREACNALKYEGVELQDAFVCSGARCEMHPCHLAVVCRGPQKELAWRCTVSEGEVGALTIDQQMWFSATIYRGSVSLDSKPTQEEFITEVALKIPNKYEMIGIQLGCTHAQLQSIGPRTQSLEAHYETFRGIYGIWEAVASPPCTWRALIEALRSESVGEVDLSFLLASYFAKTRNSKDSFATLSL